MAGDLLRAYGSFAEATSRGGNPFRSSASAYALSVFASFCSDSESIEAEEVVRTLEKALLRPATRWKEELTSALNTMRAPADRG